MSLRHIFGEAPYERPMTDAEKQRELDQERLFHRLTWRKGSTMGLCSCGKSFVDVTNQHNVAWRFDLHVKACVDQLKDRLEGNTTYDE
jgi:hypothetical protein